MTHKKVIRQFRRTAVPTPVSKPSPSIAPFHIVVMYPPTEAPETQTFETHRIPSNPIETLHIPEQQSFRHTLHPENHIHVSPFENHSPLQHDIVQHPLPHPSNTLNHIPSNAGNLPLHAIEQSLLPTNPPFISLNETPQTTPTSTPFHSATTQNIQHAEPLHHHPPPHQQYTTRNLSVSYNVSPVDIAPRPQFPMTREMGILDIWGPPHFNHQVAGLPTHTCYHDPDLYTPPTGQVLAPLRGRPRKRPVTPYPYAFPGVHPITLPDHFQPSAIPSQPININAISGTTPNPVDERGAVMIEPAEERARVLFHPRIHHTRASICKHCKKGFKTDKDRQRHVLRMHLQKGRYPCPHVPCKQSFAEAHKLSRHVRTVHLLNRPFKCPRCDSAFGERGNMLQHLRKSHLAREAKNLGVEEGFQRDL